MISIKVCLISSKACSIIWKLGGGATPLPSGVASYAIGVVISHLLGGVTFHVISGLVSIRLAELPSLP